MQNHGISGYRDILKSVPEGGGGVKLPHPTPTVGIGLIAVKSGDDLSTDHKKMFFLVLILLKLS